MSLVDPSEQSRLVRALSFALEHHGDQKRKGGDIPYVSHLLQVAGLVQEHGGDVDQAVAALLHDTIEDCESVTYELLCENFGPGVADIVLDCTDTQPDEARGAKQPWQERKDRYLDHLRSAPPCSVLVTVCDKRHNLGAMVADLRAQGPAYLDHFNAPGERQIWYFESVLEVTRGRVPERLHAELRGLLGTSR